MAQIDLSILILTTPRRRETFMQEILKVLELQIYNRPNVEILCLYDNKRRITGDKRNAILSIARGKYIAFVDDDDMVYSTYVEDILEAIKTNADCIVFDVLYTTSGDTNGICKHGIEYEFGQKDGIYYRKPAHIHVWRYDLIKDLKFPSIGNGEDMDWCKQAALLIKTQHRIDKILYHYRFNSNTTESNTWN